MNQRILGLVVLTAIFCTVGCSGNVQVTGKVTFPDGTPLTVGKVTFETDKFSASGPLKEDGTYRLGTLSERDGIPPGQYKVFIAGAMQQGGTSNVSVPTASGGGPRATTSTEMPVFMPAVAPKYTTASNSGITCDVKKSMTFNFEVEPP